MKVRVLANLSLLALLSGCGGSGSDGNSQSQTPDPGAQEGTVHGPFSTGSTLAPNTVYFDFESGSVLELSDEQAATDSRWDIAFNRTKVSLNTHADNSVSMAISQVNSDFFDQDGKPVADKFINATAETELTDYLAIKNTDLPAEDAFNGDSQENIIGGKFYNYDMSTHVVTAAEQAYFIVSSDDAFTKFRVKSLSTAGRTMSSITLGVQHQSALDGHTSFGAEQELVVDTAACSADIYIDFDLVASLSADDAWDIRLPCVTVGGVSGTDFSIHIADDAKALQDTDNSIDGIDSQALAFYGFQPDLTNQLAFDASPWYQYGLNGGHLLWSQYGVYFIKTASAEYKFQITSYYDEAGTSGNYSFRFDKLSAE